MSCKVFRFVLSAILLLNFSVAQAQSYSETALLFSRTRPAGSARVQGIGGSQIALGGDYSSALSNPAGLGMYNRSEFALSTALSSNTAFTDFGGSKNDDNRTVFNVPGLSLVWNMPKDHGAFVGGSFAVNFSRTNDFNRASIYSGSNFESSIVDYFIDQAWGSTTAQFDENGPHYNSPTGLAYYNFLIGPRSILPDPGGDDEYFTDVGWPELQQEDILVKGASNQWNFSYGANILDRFFFGGGLGVASVRYKSQKVFRENYTNPDTIRSMSLSENLDLRGSGVNLTIGAIVRPVDFLQVGVSYNSPTFYSFTETYEAAMRTNWNNFDYRGNGEDILNNESASTDIVTSDYNLTTPSRLNVGVALLSKFGFISADIERTNYANAKYSSETPGISYAPENEDIRSIYKSVINYRIGAEFRYNIYRLRAGYGVQASTYDRSLDIDNKITSITGGTGIRTKDFFIDFALVHSSTKRYFYQPYTFFDGSGPLVRMKNRSITGMITVGFTF